jgi:hypothetical protein
VIENRSSTRHPVNLTVDILHEGTTSEHTMVNMSLGGALIAHPDRLPIGAGLELTFRVPHLESPIQVKALVRWSDDEATGVQFDGLRAREVWSLNKLFETLEA